MSASSYVKLNDMPPMHAGAVSVSVPTEAGPSIERLLDDAQSARATAVRRALMLAEDRSTDEVLQVARFIETGQVA